MDELFKQCLFIKREEGAPGTAPVDIGPRIPIAVFQRIFAKPLLLIGMENALSVIEETHQKDCSNTGTSTTETIWPEMDKSSLGQTMAVIALHRKYMKNVFTSDELDQYEKFKKEAHRIKKLNRERKYLNPNQIQERKKLDPMKQLETYMAKKQGLE